MRRGDHLADRLPLERVDSEVLDALGELLYVFADHMAALVAARMDTHQEREPVWLKLSDAADHLGLHRDTLRKHAKAGVIPFEQDAPGCRMYFRRSDLDAWRHAGGAPARLAQVADLSAKRSVCSR